MQKKTKHFAHVERELTLKPSDAALTAPPISSFNMLKLCKSIKSLM